MLEKKQILLAVDTKEDFVGFLDYLNKEKESNNFSFISVKMPTETSSEDHLRGLYYIFEYMETLSVEHDVSGMYQDDFSATDIYGNVLKEVNNISKNFGIYDHNIIYFTIKLAILVNMAKTCQIDNILFFSNDINLKNKKSIVDFISKEYCINICFNAIDNCNQKFKRNFIDMIKKNGHEEPFEIKKDLAENDLFLIDDNFKDFFDSYLKILIENILNNKIKLISNL